MATHLDEIKRFAFWLFSHARVPSCDELVQPVRWSGPDKAISGV
ncbi:hypothetical protein [Bradyrhizobium sp. DASA03120]